MLSASICLGERRGGSFSGIKDGGKYSTVVAKTFFLFLCVIQDLLQSIFLVPPFFYSSYFGEFINGGKEVEGGEI